MMGVGSTLIGLIPNYDSIGFWAPVLLVAMRVVQGIGLGGEGAGATLMSMEHAFKQGRRIVMQVSRRWAHPPDWFSPTASS